MIRYWIVMALAGYQFLMMDSMPAQTKPDFCYNGATDRCQQVLNIWDFSMRNDTHQYYCTSEGEYLGWTEGHYLNAYVYGYLATEDTVYLDRVVEHFNGAICRDDHYPNNNCDPCRFTRESSGGAFSPEWGWYGLDYTVDSVTRFDMMVGEGITLQAVARFIEIVYRNPALHASYKADADYYLNLLETELIPKWDRRGMWKDCRNGEGVYCYHAHPGHLRNDMTLATNQVMEFCQMLLVMWRITEDIWYRDRAAKVLYHLKKNFYTQSGIINWNYWDPAGYWDYDGSQLKHWVGEDHRCGYKNINIEAIIEGARNGLVFTEADVAGAKQRYDIYRVAAACAQMPQLAYFDQSVLEEAFNSIATEPISWGNLVETPKFMYILKARDQRYYPIAALKTIPIYRKFDGATTDFTQAADIQAVGNVVLEVAGQAKIDCGSKVRDMANLNLDAFITIDDNLVGIDETNLPGFTGPFTITVYNVNYADPKIVRSGQYYARATVVENVPGDHLTFTVQDAGTYWVTAAAGGTVAASDGFESGDFSNGWSGSGDNLAVVTEEAHGGSYSYRVSLDGAHQHSYISRGMGDLSDYYEQFSFKLSADFTMANGESFDFGARPSAGWATSNSIAIGYNDNSFLCWFTYQDNDKGSHSVPGSGLKAKRIQKGQWYTLEYHFKTGNDGTTLADFFLNGEFLGRKREGPTTIATLSSLRMGVQYAGANTVGQVYIDDWQVSDQYIGVPQEILAVSPWREGVPAARGRWLRLPNPLTRAAVLEYTVPRNGPVSLALFNQQGSRVRTLVDGVRPAGTYSLAWDGRDDQGRTLANGFYIYLMDTGSGRRLGTLLYLR